jgi:hypothetical protein
MMKLPTKAQWMALRWYAGYTPNDAVHIWKRGIPMNIARRRVFFIISKGFFCVAGVTMIFLL